MTLRPGKPSGLRFATPQWVKYAECFCDPPQPLVIDQQKGAFRAPRIGLNGTHSLL
jgi:hypothetical protein